MDNRMDNQEYEEPTLQGLAQRLETLERENAELRHEVAVLRDSGTRPAEEPSHLTHEFEGPESPQSQGREGVGEVGLRDHFEADKITADTIATHWLRAQSESRREAVEAETTADGRGAVWARNHAQSGIGVEGRAHGSAGNGVYGQSPNFGVYGFGGNNFGDGGTGVRGVGDTGVWGTTHRVGWSGVYGQSRVRGGYGVVGDGVEGAAGVLGRNPSGHGVRGEGRVGIKGVANIDGGTAADFYSESGTGIHVIGGSTFDAIFAATLGSGSGIRAESVNGYGGYFRGGKSQLMLQPGSTAGRPTGAHEKGELYMDSNATLWVCIASGNPATWRQVVTTFA